MSFKIQPFILITMMLCAASTLNIVASSHSNSNRHPLWRSALVVRCGRPWWKALAASLSSCFRRPSSSNNNMHSNHQILAFPPWFPVPSVAMGHHKESYNRPPPWPPPWPPPPPLLLSWQVDAVKVGATTTMSSCGNCPWTLMSASTFECHFRVCLHHPSCQYHGLHHHSSDQRDWFTGRRPVLYFYFSNEAPLHASEYYQPLETTVFPHWKARIRSAHYFYFCNETTLLSIKYYQPLGELVPAIGEHVVAPRLKTDETRRHD